jgi:hypothetical protein
MGIVPIAETKSIHAVIPIAQFVSVLLISSHKICAYISKENTQIRVHRNIKTILPYFKVILPRCPVLQKKSNRFFVGQVTDVDVKCYKMTLLRKSGDNGKIFAFPPKED